MRLAIGLTVSSMLACAAPPPRDDDRFPDHYAPYDHGPFRVDLDHAGNGIGHEGPTEWCDVSYRGVPVGRFSHCDPSPSVSPAALNVRDYEPVRGGFVIRDAGDHAEMVKVTDEPSHYLYGEWSADGRWWVTEDRRLDVLTGALDSVPPAGGMFVAFSPDDRVMARVDRLNLHLVELETGRVTTRDLDQDRELGFLNDPDSSRAATNLRIAQAFEWVRVGDGWAYQRRPPERYGQP
jgi:hypothetical protein